MATVQSSDDFNDNLVSKSKFYEIEIVKVFDTIQALQKMSLEVAVFLATANLTLYGIAVSGEHKFIYFIAPLILILGLIIQFDIYRAILRYYKRAVKLQGICLGDTNYSDSSFLAISYSGTLFEDAKKNKLCPKKSFFREPAAIVFIIVIASEYLIALFLAFD